MKKCINCGSDLPDGAAYCPHCETSQFDKQRVEPPKKRRGAIAAAVCTVILVAAVSVGVGLSWGGGPAAIPTEGVAGTAPAGTAPAETAPAATAPAETTGPEDELSGIGADMVYASDGGSYRLVLTIDTVNGGVQTPQPERNYVCAEGNWSANPSQLYVYDAEDSSPANEEFMALVDSYTVEVLPRGDARQMEYSAPAADPSFPGAALVSHIEFTYGCGTNDILWTLNMKNGDTVQLRQIITITDIETITYTPEDVPMDTTEDLQSLMDYIDLELPLNTAVDIYLPPVTYTGDLRLAPRRGVSLYGSYDDEGNTTTFTGSITVCSAYMQLTDLDGIRFEGSGGTAVTAHDGVYINNCTFTGWDTAAIALEGSWIGVGNSIFEDNGVALHFNTDATYHYVNSSYWNTAFRNNGAAIIIDNLPGSEVLRFPKCVFSGNGTDIMNNAGHPLDTSGAVFG